MIYIWEEKLFLFEIFRIKFVLAELKDTRISFYLLLSSLMVFISIPSITFFLKSKSLFHLRLELVVEQIPDLRHHILGSET